MEYLLSIGIAMFVGLFLTRLTKRFNLPDVTSYLVAGLLIGPLGLGALGMSVTVAAEFGAEGAIMRNIVLFSVLIYELVGPMLTKLALTEAGEITEGATSARGVVPTVPDKKA